MNFPPHLSHLADVYNKATCLCTPDKLNERVRQIGREVSADLSELDPLVICIMNGGMIFCSQLVLSLSVCVQMDYLQISRYQDKTHGGVLQWLAKPHQNLQDRHILLVDDILDEGDTLLAASDWLLSQGAQSLKTAVLVDKQHQRKKDLSFKADYIGFQLEDAYLFGCGMDYQGYFRNLPGIYAMKTA